MKIIKETVSHNETGKHIRQEFEDGSFQDTQYNQTGQIDWEDWRAEFHFILLHENDPNSEIELNATSLEEAKDEALIHLGWSIKKIKST